MIWIRNVWWDSTWMLSGFPLGIGLTWLASNSASLPIVTIYFLVLFQTAHSISPIVLAWSHQGFRSLMMRHKVKYVGVPLAILLASAAVGIIGDQIFTDIRFLTDSGDAISVPLLYRPDFIRSPVWWLLWVYLLWNGYHFAKQNFGVLTIYRRIGGGSTDAKQRWIDLAFCMTIQVVILGNLLMMGMFTRYVQRDLQIFDVALLVACVFILLREAAGTQKSLSPPLIFSVSQALCLVCWGPWTWGLNSINHWLVAIGLASHVSSNRSGRAPLIFVGVVIVVGAAIFWLMFGKRGVFSWNLRQMIEITTLFMCVRSGIGFVHFLYDRWVWKLSDPEVQATIGRDLLTHRQATPYKQMVPIVPTSGA